MHFKRISRAKIKKEIVNRNWEKNNFYVKIMLIRLHYLCGRKCKHQSLTVEQKYMKQIINVPLTIVN